MCRDEEKTTFYAYWSVMFITIVIMVHTYICEQPFSVNRLSPTFPEVSVPDINKRTNAVCSVAAAAQGGTIERERRVHQQHT